MVVRMTMMEVVMESGGTRAISRPQPSLSVTDRQIQFLPATILHKRRNCNITPNGKAFMPSYINHFLICRGNKEEEP